MFAGLSRSTKILIAIFGFIGTVVVGILLLPERINLFFASYPKAAENVLNWWNLNTKITGTWTSSVEGWVDATDEDRRLEGGEQGPVVIQIRVFGGVADGEIYSAGLKSSYIASRILLKGDARSSDRVEGVIYDFIGGEPKALAQFSLTYSKHKGMDSLLLTTIKQGGPFLPAEARLHRDDKAMPDDLGGLSPWWMNTLLDYVRKNKKAE